MVMLALMYLNKYTHSWNRRTKHSIIRNYLTDENTSAELYYNEILKAI